MHLKIEFPSGRLSSFDTSQLSSLGKGATSDVYAVNINGVEYAAKIYKTAYDIDAEKILSMCSDLHEARVGGTYAFAWPLAVIRGERNVVGYLMPAFPRSEYYPLNYYFDSTLFGRVQTKEVLSLANRVEIAKSLSEALESMHERGLFFVDLKPQNILVARKSNKVVLLDCDGYSYANKFGERFPAKHVSPDYISPEATQKKLTPSELGLEQDKYALSVILFQLFNYAQHPFQGITVSSSAGSATNDENAAKGLYAYGLTSNYNIAPRIGSTHESMPNELRVSFDTSFASTGSRMTAGAWTKLFKEILDQKRLRRCHFFPNDPLHISFLGGTCFECHRVAARKGFQNPAIKSHLPQTVVSPSQRWPVPIQPPMKSKSSIKLVLLVLSLVLVLCYFLVLKPMAYQHVLDTTRVQITAANEVVEVKRQVTAPLIVAETPTAPIVELETQHATNFAEVSPDSVLSDYVIERAPTRDVLRIRLLSKVSAANLGEPVLWKGRYGCDPTRFEIMDLQRALTKFGFSISHIDGTLDADTHAATLAFQRKFGLAETSLFNSETTNKLGVYVAAFDEKYYDRYYKYGRVMATTGGPIIDFDINSDLPFCFYVTSE